MHPAEIFQQDLNRISVSNSSSHNLHQSFWIGVTKLFSLHSSKITPQECYFFLRHSSNFHQVYMNSHCLLRVEQIFFLVLLDDKKFENTTSTPFAFLKSHNFAIMAPTHVADHSQHFFLNSIRRTSISALRVRRSWRLVK